ncbi:MAG: asparagine synthase (glutamine-hydrolyzing), partial [Bacteroidetes bacterium]|nr:asparagine synthase (glutamine-hydrolyzing) [Bacteroidota bacterium]
MCGIAGFIDFSKSSSEQILTEMTDTLVHRGPDGGGYKIFNTENCQVGLGHRRLSIIDLSDDAAQPMKFEELHLVFNGEIYNFKEIRSQLEQLGHAFTTQSDTEVILHAYKQWGTQCVNHFIGMFAIVIYDEVKNEIFCIRDRAGVKPFFYAWQDGLFLFASELKAFAKHPRFTKNLNYDAVASFVQYGNIPAPHCIYQDCFKLQPGHYFKLKVEQNTFSSKIETQQYWSVYSAYNQPKKSLNWQEGLQQTEQILQSAVDYRMVADVPVGVFLSGGYDSSCVTALLQKSQNQQIKTFTIAVPDIGLNEAPYAKDIAQHLETDHHEY